MYETPNLTVPNQMGSEPDHVEPN